MKAYLHKVQTERRLERFPCAMIGNMDETPVYFDLVPSKTIDMVGTKSCIIRSTEAEKRHIMVVLTITADGSILPPMVIFKGKHSLKLTAPQGVLVCSQEKAWKLMHEYVEHIWQAYVQKKADELGLPDCNALLTLDSFRAHTTTPILEKMDVFDTVPCVIPGGCTSKLQPLHVSVNKPIMKGCWSQFIHNSVTAADDKATKVKTASKQQVLDWIVKAWETMKEKRELVTKSFQVTGITSTDQLLYVAMQSSRGP